MWLHAPQRPEEIAAELAGAPAAAPLALTHEFDLWMLVGGKPERVPSSEIDWKKSPWLHALDLWEPAAVQDARVRAHAAAIASRAGGALAPLNVLGLCSGYGGLELAVHIAREQLGGGACTVACVERQAYAAAVLASRMTEGALEDAPIWDDLETFDCRPWRGLVDLVVGGIPCQGASVAGKRKGVDDERWLWKDFWRIVQEVDASAFFLENVPGLLSVNGGRAFESILGDLGARGWIAEWDCVPAAAVGAPHLRDRFFLLAADPDRVGVRLEPERDQRDRGRARAPERGTTFASSSSTPGHLALADADRGGLRTPERHVHAGEPDADRRGQDVADADRAAREPHRGSERAEPGNAQGERARADSDAPRVGCDEGSRVGPGSLRERGADAGGGAQHGDVADAGRAGSQGPGARRRATADRDRPAGELRDVADPDSHGRESEWRSRQLDEGERPERGRDVDGCRGQEDRYDDALAGTVAEQLAAIVERGRADWQWSRAPVASFRLVDDGTSDWLDGDLLDDAGRARSTEGMRGMRSASRSEALSERTGGQNSLFEAAHVWPLVHGRMDDEGHRNPHTSRVIRSRSSPSQGALRILRNVRSPIDPSQGSRLAQQLPGQLTDAVHLLSHDLASRGWRHCAVEAEEAVSRVWRDLRACGSLRSSPATDEEVWRSATDQEKHRWLLASRDRLERLWLNEQHADRLHTLGNGVVPAQAAYAFIVLWHRLAADADERVLVADPEQRLTRVGELDGAIAAADGAA